MDLRTKLVFAFVGVALGSMLVLGAVTYTSARGLLMESSLRQIEGLADSKEEGLTRIVSGWQERVGLLASRTQLRLSLSDYNRSHASAESERIRRILGDALRSSRTLATVVVYDQHGDLVTWARRGTGMSLPDRVPEALLPGIPGVTYRGAVFTPLERHEVSFSTPLELDGEVLGSLLTAWDAGEVNDLVQAVPTLGTTDEVLVVRNDAERGFMALHPLRHSQGVVIASDPASTVARALRGEEGTFSEGVTDYRGELVWAATRFVPETGWGLVVKVDQVQELGPVLAFRRELVRLALAVGAGAIVLGTLLGFTVAKPIHDLAAVANRIRGGDLGARAEVPSEDEVGVLALTFNGMAEELEQRMELLREFRRFFDQSLEMLCIAGTDGYFRRVNPAFEDTLGWSTEELLSRPFLDLVHPEDLASTVQEVSKLADGIPTISFENRFECADGSYKRLMWKSQPEPDSGLMYASAHVITDRRQER